MNNNVRYTVVRKGTSLVLAAALATGMVPAIALAQDANEGDARVAVRAEAQKEFNLEVGKAYTVDVTWSSMAANFLDKTVQLVWDGTNYAIDISSNSMSFFEYMEVGGKRADLVTNDEGKQVFRVTVSDFEQKACKTHVSPMNRDVEFTLDFDTSMLPTKGEADASYEADYSLYFKGELGDRYKKSFSDKVKVTAANGAYTIELTANSLGEGNTLGDITYLGKKVPKTVNEDGSATYSIPVSSITDTYDITFGYTVSIPNRGTMTNLHPFQLVVGEATPAVSSVDRTSLTAQIVKAEAVEQGEKTDESFAKLQQAIADAYVAVDASGATDDSIASAVSALASAIQTFNDSADKSDGEDDQKVDKSALNEALSKARAIEQGKKTDEAFAALQEAISAAEKAAANENIPQAGIDAVTAQLNAAIETFNTSADASDPTPTPSEETVTTADGFKLVAGKEYALPVAFINATTGAESTAASFMEASAKVVYADGAYSVTVTPNSQGAQFLTAMMYEGKAAVRNDDGSFTISGVSAINKDIMVSVTMPAGTVDMGIRLDTSSLPTASGDPVTPDPVTPSGNEDSSNTATTDTTGQKAEQGFQVGHTYQVPISWLKHDSTEESMAAQYFGDTALVRPQSDGTFKVSFSATSEGDSHIVKLTYNNAELTKSGTQYTVSIPKADSDTVVPISMTIKEMEQLGGGAQTADMHLKLSQAIDLGTGQESVVASSTKQLTKTGDSVAGVTGVAALAVLAAGAAGAASVARRRGKQQ